MNIDRSDRWIIDPVAEKPLCNAGDIRCAPSLQRCDESGTNWSVIDDCAARGLVCAGTLDRCAPCVPDASRSTTRRSRPAMPMARPKPRAWSATRRQGSDVAKARAARSATTRGRSRERGVRVLGRRSGQRHGRREPQRGRPTICHRGLEPSARHPGRGHHRADDSLPGETPIVRTVASAKILPLNLETFKLGPREVDGSPDGNSTPGPEPR